MENKLQNITREEANKLLTEYAIIPGYEHLILERMGYKITKPRLNLKYLRNRSKDQYTYYTLDGLAETETENYLVAAGPVIGKYTGRMTGGTGKWRELWLEFSKKDCLDNITSLELANLPITTSHSTHFNARNCSIIGARIDVIDKDIIDANYLDPEGCILERFRVDLNERYKKV